MMKTWSPERARWVWLAGKEKPDNAYVAFRRSFHVCDAPKKAMVYVTADCRYRLSVNGNVVGWGPVTTNPKYKQVDVYDVSEHLGRGENVITAQVLQRHVPTMRLMPARGGFILECAELSLGTDASWRVRPAREYSDEVPLMTSQYGHQEWVDGRLIPDGWETPGFDDSRWDNATPVGDADRFWPKALELRTVPYPLREKRYPCQLVAYFGVSSMGRKPEDDPEPARAISDAHVMNTCLAKNREGLLDPHKGPTEFFEPAGDGIGFVVDLGEEMYGHPFIDLECPSGAFVDIGHGEALGFDRVRTIIMPGRGEQKYADRYISRGGRQRFEIFDTKGCRYMEIHIRHLADYYTGARAVIHEVGMIQRCVAHEMTSSFSCEDEQLNKIADICLRTATINGQEWAICDAQREQNRWVPGIAGMIFYQSFGKMELIRDTLLAFTRAQLPSGRIPEHNPPPNWGKQEELDEHKYLLGSFHFAELIYEDWLFGGRDPRQRYWLEAWDRCVDYFAGFINHDGVLANLTGLHWLEWTAVDARSPWGPVRNTDLKSWEVTAFNAWFVLVLTCLAPMAVCLGEAAWGEKWRKLAERVRAASTKRFWSPELGAYIDGVYDGIPSTSVSQTTNALAILAGFGDCRRLQEVASLLDDNLKCPVECDLLSSALYHQALVFSSRFTAALDHIRLHWGKILLKGATTAWESDNALHTGQASCIHSCASPLLFLVQNLLGVIPIEPGYRKFSVRIYPCGLAYAGGNIATPHGYIDIRWTLAGKKMVLTLTVPADTVAHVGFPVLQAGQQFNTMLVDGKPAVLTPLPVAMSVHHQCTLPAAVLDGGSYEITFK